MSWTQGGTAFGSMFLQAMMARQARAAEERQRQEEQARFEAEAAKLDEEVELMPWESMDGARVEGPTGKAFRPPNDDELRRRMMQSAIRLGDPRAVTAMMSSLYGTDRQYDASTRNQDVRTEASWDEAMLGHVLRGGGTAPQYGINEPLPYYGARTETEQARRKAQEASAGASRSRGRAADALADERRNKPPPAPKLTPEEKAIEADIKSLRLKIVQLLSKEDVDINDDEVQRLLGVLSKYEGGGATLVPGKVRRFLPDKPDRYQFGPRPLRAPAPQLPPPGGNPTGGATPVPGGGAPPDPDEVRRLFGGG